MSVGISSTTKINTGANDGFVEATLISRGSKDVSEVRLRMYMESADSAYEIELSPDDLVRWCRACIESIEGESVAIHKKPGYRDATAKREYTPSEIAFGGK